MKLYSENENYKLYQGSMLDMLEVIDKETIDAVLTDPPYELNFMGKGWDNSGIAFQSDTWKKCYEVLKPGGYLLAFGGSRTFHRIACAIEDAGFEIRDTIMWVYGSGFPKSMDISKSLDKRNGRNPNIDFKEYLNMKRKEKGYSLVDINKMMNVATNGGGFASSIMGEKENIILPTKENYLKLKEILDLDNRYDELINTSEAEREVIGTKKGVGCFTNNEHYTVGGTKANDYDITIPSTELAKKWQGWGTAMKPSYESIIIAQKPYSIEIYLLIGILDILNEVIEKCQLNLNANIVEKILKLNQAKQSVEENIVLKNAENKMFTKEDLLEVMDMLQSILMENTNLNTELLCLNFLVEICNQMSKYTTEMKINLITELKILKLLVVENILKNTTEENKIKQLGMKQNALTVEEFLKEERLKLNYMSILSAQDNVILKEGKSDLHPSLNQIIVARKPFKGSLVDNVIEYGVGGINIDECRVEPTGEDIGRNNHKNPYGNDRTWSVSNTPPQNTTGRYEGRFPANTILTYDETDFDEVCGGFPNTKSNGGKMSMPKMNSKSDGINIYNFGKYNADRLEYDYVAPADSGSASRYFYCAKASKKDRDEGLDEFEDGNITDGRKAISDRPYLRKETPRKNIHPTVKPTDLMQYLVRLVSPNGAIILDPFNGSGSTGKAVMYENKERNKNYKYIGIELTEEYLPIAKARIEYVSNMKPDDSQMNIFDLLEKEDS